MQWWNEFMEWLRSNDGQSVLVDAGIPFLAILIAGIVATVIGRSSTKRLLTLNDRENRVSAVATMIGAARRASVWNTLSTPEQQHADHVASEADVRIRLLAVHGSGLAADWAAHEIAEMKKNSVSFSFQAEQSLIDFRERMVIWQARPGRARKLFKNDLELWAYENSQNKNDIVSQQQKWAADQVASETGPVSTEQSARATPPAAESAPATTSTPAPAPAGSKPTSETPEPSAGTGPAPSIAPPAATDDEDARDEESDRELQDAIYSPPLTANNATKHMNPPTVEDDNRRY